MFPFFPIQGLKTHYDLRPRRLQCPTCSCTTVPPSLGSCFSEKGAPPPRACDGFPTAPPPHAQAPHWLRRPSVCPLPLPTSHHRHFSRGIPHDEAPHALPIWPWTKGLRMQTVRGASGLPDMPARASLQGFQVQLTRVGWGALPGAHPSDPNTLVETYVCPPTLSP